jgi:hypothetical protein
VSGFYVYRRYRPMDNETGNQLVIERFLEYKARHPMRKLGQRLCGGWSSKRFYSPAWLVEGRRRDGQGSLRQEWVKADRIRSQVHPEPVVRAMRSGVLPSDLEEQAIMAWNGDELL